MTSQPFQLPIAVDLAAVFLMALTGATCALRRGFDIIGLLVLALVTGIGGALIRDGVFLNVGVSPVLSDQRYLVAVALASLAGILFGDKAVVSERLILWVDAAALGAYAVVGADRSMDMGLAAAPAILVGVVNACGGGILRDLFVGDQPIVFKPGQFYALAALIGCLVYVPLRRYTNIDPLLLAAVAIGITFGLRVLAIALNWHTAPLGEKGLLPKIKRPRRRR